MTPSDESMKEAKTLYDELVRKANLGAISEGWQVHAIAKALDKYKAEKKLEYERGFNAGFGEGDVSEISFLKAQLKEKDEKLGKAREALKNVVTFLGPEIPELTDATHEDYLGLAAEAYEALKSARQVLEQIGEE